jgi:hypothetical protein
MSPVRFSLLIGAAGALLVISTVGAQKPGALTAPETFTAQLHGTTGTGALSSMMTIHVDRYLTERQRTPLTEALRIGAYSGFLQALRQAPQVGSLTIGQQTFALRWAREQTTDNGRTISLITDKPVYFVGGGRADAKPRAGYELGVVQLTLDASGAGTGTMAAAARVKPDGKGGVILDDYAREPIMVTAVHRVTS